MESFSKYLGFPIFLLLATWGAYETVIHLLESLNSTRTQLLHDCGSTQPIAPGLSGPAFANHVLYADWLPMYVGLVLFMVIYTLVLLMIPKLVHDVARRTKPDKRDDEDWIALMTRPQVLGLSHSKLAGYGLAAFTSICTLGILVGGVKDYLLMTDVICRSMPTLCSQ